MTAPSKALSRPGIILMRSAQIAFFLTVLLIPVRLRMDLLVRPNPPVHGDYTDFLLFASDVAMLGTVALWSLAVLIDRGRVRLGPWYLWLPLAGILVAGLVSSVTSVDPALSVYHVIRLTGLFLFFLYVQNEVAVPALVGSAVPVQGLSEALIAIGQFLSQRSVGLMQLGEIPLNPAWAGVSIVSTGSARVLRAYGLSDHPNILGGCLAFGLVLLLGVYLTAGAKTRWALMITLPVMGVGLLLTFSRAAWLAVGAGAAFLVASQVMAGHRHILKPLLWLALAIGLTLAPFAWRERSLLAARLNTGGPLDAVPAEQQSLGERKLLLQQAEQIFSAHALTGIGLGASPVAMKNAYPESTLDYQPPHLALLEAGLETGVVGGAFYLLLMVLPWLMLLRHSGRLMQPEVAGAAALLLAVTVVGLFDYYTWLLVPGRLWQWLSLGLLAAAVQRAVDMDRSRIPLVSRSTWKVSAMLEHVEPQAKVSEIPSLKHAVLHTLSYADVFDYPLTIPEIHRYLVAHRATLQQVTAAVDELAGSCAVARSGEFYTLPGREYLVRTRMRRAEAATHLWRSARRYGALLAALPFVRMVAVTGSLSMRNTEQDQDVDFMLVTTPGRLWTARACAILVTRLARLEGVRLCPNYLVTTSALHFPEHSLYVAHEVAQMIPLSGGEVYQQIRELNAWTEERLPNAQGAPELFTDLGQPRWQPLLEAIFRMLPTHLFEEWEMQRKTRAFSARERSNSEAYFSADVCKGHVDRHLQRTEMLLRQRLGRLGSI